MTTFGSTRLRARLWGLGAFAALAAPAAPARAEVSSWFSFGVGAASLEGDGRPRALRLTLPLDLGVGSPPSGAVVVGLGARALPFFGEGLATAGYARVAMQSYVVGSWGAALDAGAFTRLSGPGGPGVLGSLNLGAPWGFVLTGSYGFGNDGERVASATLGVDLLRLTVYRLAGETTWPNPKPAWRPEPPPEGGPPR